MADNVTYAANIPPQGTAPVYKRLLRGYGPLALLALALILMAVLVPTMSTEAKPETNTTGDAESGLVLTHIPGESR